ncbi:MAG: transglutaminase domain-containing protein [Clostridia bacterium]|nr:transglutaminase domain-containing protein [Clostridia bacterium]
MKNRILNHLLGALFAFLFSFCSVGCLLTGFDLTIGSPAALLVWCAVFAVLSAVLWFFRYGVWVILLLSVRGAFAVWQDGAVWDQIRALAYTVSSHYHEVYNWPVIGTPAADSFDLAMILLGYLTALAMSFCICRRTHLVLSLPVVLMPLVLCLITTDTLPEETVLWLLMFGIVLLLVTDWVRRTNPEQYAALVLRIAVPAAAALGLLFWLNPQESYVNRAAEFQKTAAEWFQQAKSTAESVVSGNITGNTASRTLNLRNVGPKSNFSFTVMRVTASYDGTIYLRGRDYDTYTGTAWESTGEREEIFPAGEDPVGTLQVVTYGSRKLLYVPYYSSDAVSLTDGYADNSESTNVYSYTVAKNPLGISSDVSGYTKLPAETEAWAEEIAEIILSGRTSTIGKVRCIAEFVRNSASYDLSTSAMSSDYSDFARWFLEESDTGYCVHFATAAAVLLRAAGIPARYVEGYMISVRADEKTLVSNREAHAWVEYYDPSSGVWQMLEVTPADASQDHETSSAEPEETETAEETEMAEETESDQTVPEESEAEEDPAEPETDASGGEDSSENVQNGNSGQNSVGSSGNGVNSGGASSGDTGSTSVQKTPFRIPKWMKTLMWILPALAVVPVQGNLRIAFRRKRWHSGAPNEMALERWRQSRRLARLTKTRIPGELEELALKAGFSQHTITEEELYRFELYRQSVLKTVGSMPWYRRYFLRWIIAVG